MSLRQIKIVVAAPADLEDEEYQLGAYASGLNHILRPRGIELELDIASDLLHELRESFATALESTDYFYVLFYKKSDAPTMRAFDEANLLFQHHAQPKIYTYFKEIGSDERVEEDVLDFMKMLDRELGHYYSQFSSIDSVKLDLILEIARDSDSTELLETRDGGLYTEGSRVLELSSLPPYSLNEQLNSLKQQRDELQAEWTQLLLALQTGQGPSAEVSAKLMQVGERLGSVKDAIGALEKDIFDVAVRLAAAPTGNTPMAQRINTARRLFQQGKLDEACEILSSAEVEADRAERLAKDDRLLAARKAIADEEREYVEGKLLLIEMEQARGLPDESDPIILDAYERCLESTIRFELEPTFFSDYILYLSEFKHFDVFDACVDKVYAYLHARFLLQPDALLHQYADTVLEIAYAYTVKGSESEESGRVAESWYQKVLPVLEKRMDEHPTAILLYDYARLSNCLGIALMDQRRFDEALVYLHACIDYMEQVKEQELRYKSLLAAAYDNASLCFYRNDVSSQESISFAEESLRLRRELCDVYPEKYESAVAIALYVLGRVYLLAGRYSEAERVIDEATALYEKLNATSALKYELMLRSVHLSSGMLFAQTGEYGQAVAPLERAREISERWYARYPDSYRSALLRVLDLLARAYDGKDDRASADEVREEIARVSARPRS